MAVIDRINGLGPIESQTIDNSRRVKAQEGPEAGGFSLPNQEDEGVIYEPSTQSTTTRPKTMAQVKQEIAEEEAEAARANLHSRFDGPGVAVELSGTGVRAATKAKEQAQSSILDIFRDTWNSIKNFFVNFWAGTEAQETDTVGVEDSIPTSDTVLDNNTLKNDPETIASFMVDYGGRHLAKNSDLLTQYDKRGHITSPNASDRKRILQGEGKVNRY